MPPIWGHEGEKLVCPVDLQGPVHLLLLYRKAFLIDLFSDGSNPGGWDCITSGPTMHIRACSFCAEGETLSSIKLEKRLEKLEATHSPGKSRFEDGRHEGFSTPSQTRCCGLCGEAPGSLIGEKEEWPGSSSSMPRSENAAVMSSNTVGSSSASGGGSGPFSRCNLETSFQIEVTTWRCSRVYTSAMLPCSHLASDPGIAFGLRRSHAGRPDLA